jgi:hypothetical protein
MAVEALSPRPALRIDTSVANHTAVDGTDTGSVAAPATPVDHKADSVKLVGARTDSGIYSQGDFTKVPPRKPVPTHPTEELTPPATPIESGASVDEAIPPKLPPRTSKPHPTAELTPPATPIGSDGSVDGAIPPALPLKPIKPHHVSAEPPLLPPRPSRPQSLYEDPLPSPSRPSISDLSGAGYDLGPVMESGVTSEVLQVIASKNLSQITMELKTRERLLNAAQEDLARAQSQSRHHPENPKLKASISEAKQNIEQEQANIQELQKAEKAQTPWYQKAMTGLNNPLAQMGAMVGLPMAISGVSSLFGGDKSSGAGQTPPSNGDPNSASAGNTDMMNTPLNKTQISYLTAGIPGLDGSMPGAYPGGGSLGTGFIGSAQLPANAGLIG